MALKETPWFYHPDLDQASLMADEVRHAVSALRLVEGDNIVLTTGTGKTAKATILENKKGQVQVKIGAIETADYKPSKALIVGKMHHVDRAEWLIEKGQELGLAKLVFVEMDRCGPGRVNLDRAKRIAISALKQSHQAWLMDIFYVDRLESAIQLCSGKGIYCYLAEDVLVSSNVSTTKADFAVVGPEADFSLEEVHMMKGSGLVPVSLGPTRLRTETAALAAAVFLQINV